MFFFALSFLSRQRGQEGKRRRFYEVSTHRDFCNLDYLTLTYGIMDLPSLYWDTKANTIVKPSIKWKKTFLGSKSEQLWFAYDEMGQFKYCFRCLLL